MAPEHYRFLAQCIREAGAANASRRHDAAIGWCRRALKLAPELPEAWHHLGVAQSGLGRVHEATEALAKAAGLAGNNPDAQNSIGLQMLRIGELDHAERCLLRALAAAPHFAFAHSNLGLLRQKQGRLEEAVAAFGTAIALQPNLAAAHANLGGTLNSMGKHAAGEAACRRATEIDPALPVGWSNLGSALLGLHRIGEAEVACRKAIALDPELPDGHFLMAQILMERGAFREALAEGDIGLANDPHDHRRRSVRIFCLNYASSSPAEMLAEVARFEKAVSRSVTRYTSWNCSPDPDRRLRIGLVSGDFRRHPVGYLLEGPLRNLDMTGFEVIVYSSHLGRDELTTELESRCAAWNPVVDRSDAELARKIHEDGIDILVDLAGHTDHNRLPAFAWKPAPVQASWLGYFATTGLRAIDWKIGDPRVTPAGEEHHFTERIWRLPDSCFCFSPPRDAPEVAPLPCASSGHVTYGCFNSLTKVNERVIATWSRILGADPASRLFLKTRSLAAAETRDALVLRFARHGIQANRLLLEGQSSYADYLAAHARVDIALDPFPYPGGMTTGECLWMGVPVVTLTGDRFVAHQGESLLAAAGLPQWIASNEDAYVAAALQAAADRDALARTRAGMRGAVATSPLFDAARFARNLESALRGMWHEWCRSAKPRAVGASASR